ncbi:MAG TPA: ABC transporter permease [Terracidiphilus sp.]|jgi:predicted permease
MNFRSLAIRLIAQPLSWARAMSRRRRLEKEMEAELATHLEYLAADLVRTGYAPDEAARRARIALGSSIVHKEEMRAALGLRGWDEMRSDLRYGARVLRKSLGFTAVAATSLALAIGANTTIFSVARQVLYERLAVPHAVNLRLLAWSAMDRHRAVHHIWGDDDPLPGGRTTSTSFSYPAYQQLRAANRSMGDLFAFKVTAMNATIRTEPQRIQTEMVSGNYYAELGVRPQLGRAIQPGDEGAPGQGPVAILSEGLWERSFARSPAVLGEIIKISDITFTIIGVNPHGFTGAKNVQQSPDVFVPLSMQPLIRPMSVRAAQAGKPYASALEDPNFWWVNVMGRTWPGTRDATAQAALAGQLNAIVRATMPVRPGDDLPHLELRDGSRGLFTQEKMFAKPMAVLLTLVGFVLLLACANIANLMLARGAQRQREMSVRLALGAGRTRILRQMLVESLLLAGMGGTGGLFMGYLGRNIIPRMTENAWERSDFHVHFDWNVFAFTAGVTLLTGLLFGMAPALAAARSDVTHGLKESAKTTTRRRKGAGGKALVAFQIALSTLLVIGAGLFLRTLAGLSSVEVGFRTDHLLLVPIDPPQGRYPAGKDVQLHERLERAFAALPGVESVAVAMESYVSDGESLMGFYPQGEKYDPQKHQEEDFNVVGNRFYETLGIPIVAGRSFGTEDTRISPKVAIVNQKLAATRFPNQNPVGKMFSLNGHDADGHGGTLTDEFIRIVGVCGDTRYSNLRQEPPAQFFLPYVQQSELGGVTFEIRTRLKPETILPALRKEVRQIDPDLPVVNVRTQEQQIAADVQQERIFVTLTSGFGLLALALASVGIYGIMAYSVSQRTNEIGIRLALGAKPSQVRAMILRESSWLAGGGVLAGLASAMVLSRAIQSLLFGIRSYDPLTLSSGVALLLLVALAASWIPARRAAGVQPMEALRHE